MAQNDAGNAVAGDEDGDGTLKIETRGKRNGTHSAKSSAHETRDERKLLTFNSSHDDSQHRGVGGGGDAE